MADESIQRLPLKRADLEVVDVCGETVIWDPEANRVHRLDPVGSALWPFFDGTTTVTGLAADTSAVWKIPIEDALDAIDSFVASAAQANLLVPFQTTEGV